MIDKLKVEAIVEYFTVVYNSITGKAREVRTDISVEIFNDKYFLRFYTHYGEDLLIPINDDVDDALKSHFAKL